MRYLRILAIPEARRLLLASFVRAQTAFQLSEKTGIPIAQCYRLLWRLWALGLMKIEAFHITFRGRGKPMFRTRLQGLELFSHGEKLMAKIKASKVFGS